MVGTTPRTPALLQDNDHIPDDFHVNELAADKAGAMSPYGPELEFPLPLHKIRYRHPGRAERPNLAEGR